MYTVRRGSSYDFQIRVPQPFVKRLGVTHLRATLGRISAPEARRRASILAGGILEILMSSVSSTASRIGKLSDEELLATCRWWLRQEPWSGILKRDIDALAPGEVFQRKSTLARNFIQGLAISHFHEESGTWDDEVGIWDARRDEGEQALQASGYRNPTSADCLRAADVMERLINDRVEARYRELITPDDAPAPVAIVPPQPMPPFGSSRARHNRRYTTFRRVDARDRGASRCSQTRRQGHQIYRAHRKLGGCVSGTCRRPPASHIHARRPSEFLKSPRESSRQPDNTAGVSGLEYESCGREKRAIEVTIALHVGAHDQELRERDQDVMESCNGWRNECAPDHSNSCLASQGRA